MLKIIFIVVLVFSFGLKPVSAAQKTSFVTLKKTHQKTIVKKQVMLKQKETFTPFPKAQHQNIKTESSVSSSSTDEVLFLKPTEPETQESLSPSKTATSIPEQKSQEDTKEKLKKLQVELKEIKKVEPVKIKPIEPSYHYSAPQVYTPQLRADPLLPYYNRLSPF